MTKHKSTDTLVHDLEADEAVVVTATMVDLRGIPTVRVGATYELPGKACYFCAKDALFEGAKQVQYVPYTDKAICVECARKL